MTNLFFRGAAALLIGGLFASATQAKAPVSHSKKAIHKKADIGDSSQWKPDPKLLSQLGPARQFGGFSMRVPVGFKSFTPKTLSDRGSITSYTLKSPTRSDGTFLILFVIIGSAASGYHTGTPDELLNSNGGLDGKPNLTKSDIENGKANGLELSREYFKYTASLTDLYARYHADTNDSHIIHGFHYVTTDGQTDAIVVAVDAEPYNATSLPLAEAAALTLRRTD